MMEDLRTFIDQASRLCEVRFIEDADWDLEIGAVAFLAAKWPEAPALLFDRIKSYPSGYRVFVNPYSNDSRMALNLGLSPGKTRLALARSLKERLNQTFTPIQ